MPEPITAPVPESQPAGETPVTTSETPKFDDWITTQAPEIQEMLATQTHGLKSALENERSSRKDLERQMRDLAGKAEKGSEAQTKLTEMADKMSDLERRAAFYETASANGVSNPRLAFLAAEQFGFIDQRGRVDYAGLKANNPELFTASRIPPGNAGAGNNQPPKPPSMNDYIRKAAGRT